jgi:hypothetical protein
MLTKNKSLFIGALGLLIFSVPACKDKVDDPIDMSYNYFPVNEGHTVIYDVDSLFYDGFDSGKLSTFRFQIKEYVLSTFKDNEGKEALLLERYRRNNDSMPWQFMHLWTFSRTPFAVEKVESNQRFVKLLFPPSEGKAWNGNQLNSIEPWEYYYLDVDRPKTIGTHSLDSTLVVEQIDDSNFVYVKRAYEIYAKNIGMVYKRIDTLQQTRSQVPPYPIENHGVRYIMTLNSYSN